MRVQCRPHTRVTLCGNATPALLVFNIENCVPLLRGVESELLGVCSRPCERPVQPLGGTPNTLFQTTAHTPTRTHPTRVSKENAAQPRNRNINFTLTAYLVRNDIYRKVPLRMLLLASPTRRPTYVEENVIGVWREPDEEGMQRREGEPKGSGSGGLSLFRFPSKKDGCAFSRCLLSLPAPTHLPQRVDLPFHEKCPRTQRCRAPSWLCVRDWQRCGRRRRKQNAGHKIHRVAPNRNLMPHKKQ